MRAIVILNFHHPDPDTMFIHFSFLFAFGFASPTPAPPAFSAMNPAPITLEGTINFNNCLYGLSSIFGTDTSDEDRCER